MDEQLAAIYGTGNHEPENDLEKMAAAELLVKLAEEEGVDLNQFSDQEISGMITDLYKSAEFPPKKEEKKEHEERESPEKEKKEEEKVAEADFLGRVMAHSMVHELREIEKEAGVGDKAKAGYEAVKGGISAAGKYVKDRPKAYQMAGSELKHAVEKGKGLGERAKLLGRAAKIVAPEAGVAAAGGGAAALALHKHKEKKGSADESALEALAQQAAFEMAKNAGYIDGEGNFLVETQKQASALDLAVEQRALQICEENGIPVEWNE